MRKPRIIYAAITGSLPTKENYPAVPISIAEETESTQAAFEAVLPLRIAMCAMTHANPLLIPNDLRD